MKSSILLGIAKQSRLLTMLHKTSGALILMCFAASGQAETIFETFNSDPLTRGWTATANSSTWTHIEDGGGYLRAHFQGDAAGTLNRYSIALANPITASTEFWMESDIKLESVPGTYAQHRSLSGLYGNADNNQVSSIAQSYAYTVTANNTYAFFGRTYNSAGTASDRSCYDSTGVRTGYPDRFEYVVRAVLHNFGNGTARLDMYNLAIDPTASGTPWMSTQWHASGDIPVNTGTDLFQWFGLGSLNSTATLFQELLIDNLYFSTEGRNANAVLPSFVPEPSMTTFGLLGLAALLLRRRR